VAADRADLRPLQEKLGLASRPGLVMFGLEHDLLPFPDAARV
jgi:hypothetical protein